MKLLTALVMGSALIHAMIIAAIGMTDPWRGTATTNKYVVSEEAKEPAQPQTKGSRAVVVLAGPNGMFMVGGAVNGIPTLFLVDTGASEVALVDAGLTQRMNLARGVEIKMATMNGVIAARQVRLPRVEVGHIVLNEVEGVLVPEAEGSTNLLGMSFLSKLKRWEYQSGKLLLEQ